LRRTAPRARRAVIAADIAAAEVSAELQCREERCVVAGDATALEVVVKADRADGLAVAINGYAAIDLVPQRRRIERAVGGDPHRAGGVAHMRALGAVMAR
jgi:hypothetical protein